MTRWLSSGRFDVVEYLPSCWDKTAVTHRVACALTRISIMLRGVPVLALMAIVGLDVHAEARAAPCQDLIRLRNAASEAWTQAMRVAPSERCGALYHASLAAEATRDYANNNRGSCDISASLLNQVEGYHRQARQARD